MTDGDPATPVPQGIAVARDVIQRAIDGRVFPAAVAEVGNSRGPLWHDAFGALTFESGAAATQPDTLFDLASLTKPIATTTLAMRLVTTGALRLDEPVSGAFPEWRGAPRDRALVGDLLEHASGLPARLVDRPPDGRREFEHEICRIPLEHAPRERSIYSDLGFILLGFLVGDRGGASLSTQFDTAVATLLPSEAPPLAFGVRPDARHRAAPTWPLDGDRRRGRELVGVVHDDYAAALDGVAGHAGLFGTATAVGSFARLLLRSARGDDAVPAPLAPAVVARMLTKSGVSGSSRALGWDAMLPSSSCGTRLSPAAFGHVGFTGTSLWIDPVLDRYFVLLSNRACRGGGTVDAMRTVRRAFHDALATIHF